MPKLVVMNHVGISEPNIAEAVMYYTQKMGDLPTVKEMACR